MRSKSIQSRLVKSYFYLTERKSKHRKEWFLKNNQSVEPYSGVNHQIVLQESFDNRSLWRIRPTNIKPERTLMFIHGGAFAKNFQPIHWKFVNRLVENLNAEVIAPDYPLLPSSTYAGTQQYFLDLFRKLASEINIEEMYIIADTSGAIIALNAVQQFRNIGIPQPKELLMLSPWLDLSLSNPNIDSLVESDPIHDRDVLKNLAADYAHDLPINDPAVSPIYADTRRIAPITVFVGTHDILLADCRKLKTLSESKPVIFNYREFDGMFNNWMYYDIPESRNAREQLFFHIIGEPSEFEKAMQENTISW